MNQKQPFKIVSERLEYEAADEAINHQNDPFKDLSTDEVKETINDLRKDFPNKVRRG